MDDTLREIRNTAIRRAYFDSLRSLRQAASYVSTEEVIQQLMKIPAPRFFITYDNAHRIISLMHRNKPVHFANENKRLMYKELYNRFIQHKLSSKEQGYCALKHIIEQPAPSYFVSTDTMRGIVYSALKNR